MATAEAVPEKPSKNWATNPAGRAWLSLFEFLLGCAIVIGHNVYHVVPNEVPILFVMGWISIRLRDGGWRAIGLAKPASWRNTIAIAVAAAAVRILGGNFVVEPLAHRIWQTAVEVSPIGQKLGVKDTLLWLGIIWTFAAFGEEMSYRGYLLTRCADLGGRTKAAYWGSVIVIAVLFGYGHFYKGPTGIIDSAFAGLVLGVVYLVSRRNLWTCILAHGFIDTFGIIAVLAGWNT